MCDRLGCTDEILDCTSDHLSELTCYTNAAISTALDNYRALLLYSNNGFHAVDTTRPFSRQLP